MIICHYLCRYFGFQYSLTKLYLALYLFFFTIGYSCNLGYISEEYDPGLVQSMDCQNMHVSGIVRPNTAVTGVNFTIPYTGGNGGIYMAQTIESKGVTGLTAILTADTLGSSGGSFSFLVSGVAQGEGDAVFDIEVCGRQCTVNIPVSSIDANVNSIDCAGVTVSDSIIAGVDVNGNAFSVPYYGGNGGVHSGQTVDSEGVLGLKATLPVDYWLMVQVL